VFHHTRILLGRHHPELSLSLLIPFFLSSFLMYRTRKRSTSRQKSGFKGNRRCARHIAKREQQTSFFFHSFSQPQTDQAKNATTRAVRCQRITLGCAHNESLASYSFFYFLSLQYIRTDPNLSRSFHSPNKTRKRRDPSSLYTSTKRGLASGGNKDRRSRLLPLPLPELLPALPFAAPERGRCEWFTDTACCARCTS